VTLSSASTEQLTAVFDMRGVEQILFVIITGTISDADATYAVSVYHGNTVNSETSPTSITDSALAPDDVLMGTEAAASFTFADDAGTRVIGYYPGKGTGRRWVRLGVTPTGDAGSLPLAVLVVSKPLDQPVVAT
jgi:hypothetical protein